MKRLLFTSLLLSGMAFMASAQTMPTIDVYESTLKVSGLGDASYMCGLAEGDQLIFSFEEVDKKELKQLEIYEYPSNSKFMDYKTSSTKKTLSITETGIYVFHFTNSALGGRVCKFKIQRIPASEKTKNFNTNVYKHTVADTTYTVEQERFLVKSDTSFDNFSRTVKVHSSTNLTSDNTNTITYTLPANAKSWSYYIGVNQSGEQAFQDAVDKFGKSAIGLVMKDADPLAAFAAYGISFFSKVESGDAIDYYILTPENASLYSNGQQFYYIRKGQGVINDFARTQSPLVGTLNIRLINNNLVMPDQVIVKISTLCVKQQWDSRPVKKMHVENKEELYLKN